MRKKRSSQAPKKLTWDFDKLEWLPVVWEQKKLTWDKIVWVDNPEYNKKGRKRPNKPLYGL